MKFNTIISSLILLSTLATAAHAEIAVIVSRDNHNAKIDVDTIANIFLAKRSRFPNDERATAIEMKKRSSTRNEFGENFLGKSPSQLSTYWSRLLFTGRAKPNKEVSSAEEMKKLIAKNPDLIGYIDAKDVDNTVRVVNKK